MDELKKCVVEGCENIGKPAKGLNFYVCGECSENMEVMLDKLVRMESKKERGVHGRP